MRRSISCGQRSTHLRACLGILTVTLASLPGQTQAATGAVFGPNIKLAGTGLLTGQAQIEPTIAVNPADSLNLVAGFMDSLQGGSLCRAASTRDGGGTWSVGGSTPLQSDFDDCFDPSLAGDPQGTFYYAYLDVKGSRGASLGAIPTDLLVARSNDGGGTFPGSSAAFRGTTSLDIDKPYIAVDAHPLSPFRGNIYLSWTEFTSVIQINVQVSRDGASSWSEPVHISRTTSFPEAVNGSLPVVAPDGAVYVFYAEFNEVTGPLSIKFSKSTDGGQTWTSPADVASKLPSPGFFWLKNADPNFGIMPFTGIFSNSYPTAAIAADGTIYVAWVDFPNGSCSSTFQSCMNSDVRLSASRNGGKTWTKPLKVTDETNPTDQFLPWIAIHPDGLLSILWSDKRLDPQNVNFDAFYTNTLDGKSFLSNVRVSSETSITGVSGASIGDYNNLAVTDGGIFPIWNDLRSRSHFDIFTAKGLLQR